MIDTQIATEQSPITNPYAHTNLNYKQDDTIVQRDRMAFSKMVLSEFLCGAT